MALGARLFIDNIVAPPLASPNLATTDINSVSGAHGAMGQLERDMEQVLASRAALGASRVRLTAAADDLTTRSTSLLSSRSEAVDADYASATSRLAMSLAANNAAGLVLRQARTIEQAALSLVRSNDQLFGA